MDANHDGDCTWTTSEDDDGVEPASDVINGVLEEHEIVCGARPEGTPVP